MRFSVVDSKVMPGALLAGFILAVAGCQSGDSGSVLSAGTADAPPPKVKESDLTGFCPRVVLREGTAYFNTYAKGGDGDATKVIYQASIADVTRGCKRDAGMLNLDVAVAGKIVPGPLGAVGKITMPIRIAVVQGTNVLFSELYKHEVAVSDPSAASQFVFQAPTIPIPDPTDRNVQIFAGYDEGPPKQAKTAKTQ
jgi:hypothetical protein